MYSAIVRRILDARVYDVSHETPLHRANFMSAKLGCNIFLKREDLQPIYSFKCRGAYNRLTKINDIQQKLGVIAASAGNHAQGVAYGAQKLGIPATIVMPTTTPDIKIRSVRARGAEVVLYGDNFDDALEYSQKMKESRGLTFLHPFDDLDVIAGQGTVAVELLRQLKEPLDAVFIPVGGGGLASGMAAYIKFVRPEVLVIGVEPEDAACLRKAISCGKPAILSNVGSFADGVAVKQIGQYPFEILKDACDKVITVSTDEICAAVKDVFEDVRSVNEPAGALSVAGLKKYIEQLNDGENVLHRNTRNFAAILSGANVNFDRIWHIAERAVIGDRREALFAVTIPEKKGSFLAFCNEIGSRNITEFNYRYADSKEAHIFVGINTSPDKKDRKSIIDNFSKAGFPVVDITDDEVAKSHLRHMVGGRSVSAGEELTFRFEFPEKPGALLRFLNCIGDQWNISAFHYRNHGAAYGRVMVALQAPSSERKKLKSFLDEIGYVYYDETDNVAVDIFLRH